MTKPADLLDAFNFIDRAEWLLSVIRYRDLGRIVRIAHDTTGDKDKTGDKFEAMLKRYRVVVFGRRATSKQIIFSVNTAQADWAEYLLQREGANVVSLFNRNNARWAAKHNGIMPTPWDELKRK